MEGWESINLLTWDATIVDTFAASYLKVSQSLQVRPQRRQQIEKKVKYSTVSTKHWFIPVAVETMGSINQEGSAFLDEAGNRIVEMSEDPESTHFLTKDLVL